MNTPCRPFALLMALSIASPVGLTSCNMATVAKVMEGIPIPGPHGPFIPVPGPHGPFNPIPPHGPIPSSGDAVGRVINLIVYYAISQQQQAQAESTANRSLQNSKVRQKMKSTQTKYVAVPVKKDRSNSGQSTSKAKNLIVLVDAETGKPKGKAFEPNKSSYREGEEISVSDGLFFGKTKAIVGTSFSGI